MDFFSVLKLFGGLAVFLFGMNVMGDALEKSSGSKLKSILENLTSSPLKGVLLGAAVTAVIQSSSATTVMVVGFVNSGIMTLSQSIGIIMGANIGTTVTSWLLSLTGIQSDNFFVTLLKPASFTPVLAVIGIVLNMISKDDKKRNIGNILIGFAVLILGMDNMSAAVKPLADVPEFRNILILFSNPLLGVLTGALLTAIIQSSSASVGILQALSVTGSITYSNAIPIVMGQNIGTCVTAIISSIGANKNAKRAAVVHLCFNIIGTVSFLVLFYAVHSIVKFQFVDNSVGAAQIAVIHTVFNVFSTMVILPFNRVLEKLAYIIIKDTTDKKEKNQLLDERFIATPSIAIAQAKRVAIDMATISQSSVRLAMDMLDGFEQKNAEAVEEAEGTVDKYEDTIGTYLVKLSHGNLSVEDSHECSKLLHIIGDLERLSDHAMNIADVAKELYTKGISFSDDTVRDITIMGEAVKEVMELTVDAFVSTDLRIARRVEPLEEMIDNLKAKIKKRYITKIQNNEYSMEIGFILSDLLTNYERIADHCSNIAVCLIEVENDSYETHEYLNRLRADSDAEFKDEYEEYRKKYHI